MRKIIACAVLALAILAPSTGYANHEGASCSGALAATANGLEGGCEATFNLDASDHRFVSILSTTGTFKQLGATGSVTLDWYDAAGKHIVGYACFGTRAYVEGATDKAGVNCTQDGPKEKIFKPGVQRLVVGAFMRTGDCPVATCNFVGTLRLSKTDELI